MTNQDSFTPLNIDVPGDPEYRKQTITALNPGNILLRRFRRHPGAMVGMVVLSVLIIAALLAFLSPYPANQSDMGNRLQSPSSAHIMGTDALGRDMLTRILYGGRIFTFSWVDRRWHCARYRRPDWCARGLLWRSARYDAHALH